MESLQKIKHRIYSVNSTKKITKAMQLVATAKFGRIKNNFENVKEYYKSVEQIFNDLMLQTTIDIDALLNVNAWTFTAKRKLYIVFGSDIGLCGSYNSEVTKKIYEVITPDDILIVIGSKLLTLLKKDKSLHIIQTITQIGDTPTYDIARVIANKLYDVLQISLLSSVNLIYTNYLNPIKFDVVVQEIFPITPKRDSLENKESKVRIEVDKNAFEPNPDVILKNSFPIFFEAAIYHAIFSSKLAETSSRRTAMEQASDNAQDIIEDLTIQYNSSRQAKITQEITEIVSGNDK